MEKRDPIGIHGGWVNGAALSFAQYLGPMYPNLPRFPGSSSIPIPMVFRAFHQHLFHPFSLGLAWTQWSTVVTGPPWQFLQSALPRSSAALPRLFGSVRGFAAPRRALPWRREARCGYGAAERLGRGRTQGTAFVQLIAM